MANLNVDVGPRSSAIMESIGKGLKTLAENAEDAEDLEFILNRAISAIFISLPDGKSKYGDKHCSIGHVWLTRFYRKTPSGIAIMFSNCGRLNLAHDQFPIGEINLRDRRYSLKGAADGDDSGYHVLMEDTGIVMKSLGLSLREPAPDCVIPMPTRRTY